MPTRFRLRSFLATLAPLLVLLTACGPDQHHIDLRVGEEDQIAHAVSHILIRITAERDAAEARKRAYDVYAQLKEGRAFEDLARTYSDHASKSEGGFIGFVPTKARTRFSGAVQAMEVGQTSRPVETDLGYQIIKRHAFEEGRRLEAKYMYAVYGFMLPWQGLPNGRLEKEAARAEGQRVVAALRRGETNLLAERERLLPPTPNQRQDAFLFLTSPRPNLETLMREVKRLSFGEYADPIELEQGFAIVQRRPILRAVVRHILVSDIGSPDRPLRVTRTPERALARIRKAAAELGGNPANWSKVLKGYTDDDTAERPGGMLGVIQNGDLPPALEEAVLATASGAICDHVVRSPRGFHLLWRVK